MGKRHHKRIQQTDKYKEFVENEKIKCIDISNPVNFPAIADIGSKGTKFSCPVKLFDIVLSWFNNISPLPVFNHSFYHLKFEKL